MTAIVQVPESYIYELKPGTFGLVRNWQNSYGQWLKGMNWPTCRDSFDTYYWSGTERGFFYVCDVESVQKFIQHIETHLQLVFRTKVYKTDKPNICYIRPARFWRVCRMRMSFFTIVLKAALKYEGNGWQTCLYEQPYAARSKEAVAAFLNGKTVYQGRPIGWYRKFESNKLKEQGETPLKWLSEPNSFWRTVHDVAIFVRRFFFTS